MVSLDNAYMEYRKMIKLLESGENDKTEVYQKLMDKEQNVLDVVNRVAQKDQKEKQASKIVLNESILDLVMLFSNTWKNIFRELFIEQRFHDAVSILYTDDRKIYVGIMLVLISFILFFIDISK